VVAARDGEVGMTWTLHLGDCLAPDGLASLADDSVDVCVTDPPYEAEAHTEQRRQKGKSTTVSGNVDAYREVKIAPLTFDAITDEQRVEVACHIARVCRKRAIVFCQAEAVSAWKAAFNATSMPYRRALPWIKPDAMPSLHGRWPGQGYESIVLAQKPSAPACPIGGKARVYTMTRDPSLYRRGGASSSAAHPTTKPLALMLEILSDFTDPNDLILDPFAGSGTTGVAALQLGRRFIGWEMNAEYHAIATRRLSGDRAILNPAQPELFGAGSER